MQIEPGKTYKSRLGKKVQIYTSKSGGATPVHGTIGEGNLTALCAWTANGFVVPGQSHPNDIIAEWKEAEGRLLGYVTADGHVGLFHEGQVPEDVAQFAKRAPWLDEPGSNPGKVTT